MIAEEVLKISLKGLELCAEEYSLDNYLDDFGGESKIRAKVSSVLFTYYRNKLTVDYIIKHFAKGKIKRRISELLSVTTTQILYQTGIRPEISVDVAVNHTKKTAGKNTAGFVNAVLRNIVRNKDNINNILKNAPESVKVNLPEFVLKRWNNFYSPEQIKNILSTMRQPQNNIFYRIIKNAEIEIIEGSELLENKAFESKFIFYKHGIAGEVINSDALKNGGIYIQDPATSLATSSIKFKGIGKILDACSAPGGKTLMLSELYPESQVYAMDRSAKRLEKVKQNIERTGCDNVTVITSDVINADCEKSSFDVVFLDVPCSNSGVLRKRPDALWRLNKAHILDIIDLQKRILNSAKRFVKSGGEFVYSTCSIEADENIYQIKNFLEENEEFELEYKYQLLPDYDNDGAFVSVMIKK
jgi:16S rRNA (cytosine967-C5)-methyltransferase